jgi:site-specific DNA-methyltransferase (adenine-specific)
MIQLGIASLYEGDCLDVMPLLADNSIDMVLADLPYGTTACKWDTVIPFDRLWAEYRRICKGTIVLTSAQPFTSALIMSNVEMFKYQWVWCKSKAVGFVNAKLKPMPKHEDILVFSAQTTANRAPNNMIYNPQDLKFLGKNVRGRKGSASDSDGNGYGRPSMKDELYQEFTNYPTSLLEIPSEGSPIHPTQKPVALMEYLLRTYTNEGMTVLDNTMGSGTVGVACINTNRRFIGIEKPGIDKNYYPIACSRIAEAVMAC